MDAFYRLSASRQVGMSVGAIPFEAVDAYAARYGFDNPEDFDELYTLLRAVDSAYLEAIGENGQGKGRKTAADDTITRGSRG